MIQRPEIDASIIKQGFGFARGRERILLCPDSNHTHVHILSEVNAYPLLVSSGSYCIVFNKVVNDLPKESLLGGPWSSGGHRKAAAHSFLELNSDFEIDQCIDAKAGVESRTTR